MNRVAKRHQKTLARRAARKRNDRPPRTLGKTVGAVPGHRISELIQNGVRLHLAGRVQEAEPIYRQVLDIDPDHADANHLLGGLAHQAGYHEQARELISRAIAAAPNQSLYHFNLGTALQELGRLEDALASYQKALAIEPSFADAHNYLGVVLGSLGRMGDAVASYQKALAIKPDFADAHRNLGATLRKMGRLEDAVTSYQKALAIQPDIAEAQGNLGIIFQKLGRLGDAVACYHKALSITPDIAEVWNNLRIATKATQFLEGRGVPQRDRFKGGLSHAARVTSDFALFEYYLEGFRPHEADESFRKAVAALPPKASEEVSGNGTDRKPAGSPHLPEKLVALLHFGRSGTGFFHGLIDGHPEISTLPSIYLRGFFNAGIWEKLSADGWLGLPERFADEFAVLFDATSPKPIPGMIREDPSHTGAKDGMTTLGEGGDESLSLDRGRFCAEAVRLMEYHENIDPGLFLLIVHAAFEKTIGTKTDKHTVFYHIHNPDDFAKINFLRYMPDARLVMTVREPLQSCESWIPVPFEKNDYDTVITRIIAMLFAIDQIPFRMQDSIGIRLEDLKRNPKATLRALCAWLGVDETPSLYETTAQGKKWWGDPSSPEYEKSKAKSPFDEAPIRRAVGQIFSEKDQFVLRTLFYPFSVRFGYREPDPIEFKNNLREVRPLLDDMLDFEKVMSERSGIDPAQFKRSGSYLVFHAGLLDRWDVLDEFGDYPNMLTPLEID